MAVRNQKLASPLPDSVSNSTPRNSGAIVRRLFRRTDAARYLSVSEQTLDAFRAMGYLTPVPLPDVRGVGLIRIPLYDIRDLDDFVDRMKGAAQGGISETKTQNSATRPGWPDIRHAHPADGRSDQRRAAAR
jgi:hypothetical protein